MLRRGEGYVEAPAAGTRGVGPSRFRGIGVALMRYSVVALLTVACRGGDEGEGAPGPSTADPVPAVEAAADSSAPVAPDTIMARDTASFPE